MASLKLIGLKPREEFVFEVFFAASILPLPSFGNHRPNECVTWAQRFSLEYN